MIKMQVNKTGKKFEKSLRESEKKMYIVLCNSKVNRICDCVSDSCCGVYSEPNHVYKPQVFFLDKA